VSTLFPADLLHRWRQQILARYGQWLKRRLPAAASVVLQNRRLFIFPSRSGGLFLVVLALLLLLAINYQSNLVYGLAFWLFTVFIVAVHFTHANLMGLRVSAGSVESVYAGQLARCTLTLDCSSRHRGHTALKFSWPESSCWVSVPAQGRVSITLERRVIARGWYQPPRVKVESWYPLGLLRCWSFIELDWSGLGWPKPEQPSVTTHLASAGHGARWHQQGGDDLTGFRDYREGDPLHRVSWRSFARQQPLQVRQFSTPQSDDMWLSWDQFETGTQEQRLSWLCWLAIRRDASGQAYGLRLPNVVIQPGTGDRHRMRVLRELALFGEVETPS